MQITVFQCLTPRRISAAFSNSFVRGILHPERILDYHDLFYVTEGEWEVIQNGERFLLEADDVIILAAHQQHGGSVPCRDGTKTMYVHVSAAEEDRFINADEAKGGEEMMPLPTVIHCRDYPQVKSIFLEIVSTFSSQLPYRNARLDSLFGRLLVNLYDAETKRRNAGHNDFVDNVLRVIHASPQLYYTNEELATMFFVSPKTLVARFKAQTGSSPYQYQLNYKLRSIEAQLITQPQLKLYELAVNYGFYDEFHLSRVFKKVYGVSPREYRKSVVNKKMPHA